RLSKSPQRVGIRIMLSIGTPDLGDEDIPHYSGATTALVGEVAVSDDKDRSVPTKSSVQLQRAFHEQDTVTVAGSAKRQVPLDDGDGCVAITVRDIRAGTISERAG